MHTQTTEFIRARISTFALLLLSAAALLAGQARSQELEADSLEALVAPVALYPDDVLGIILPAATFPLDVVRAARFLEDKADEPALQPDDAWDDSVVALLNYPEVIRMMNDDIDWTWALGEAVLLDQAAVLEAAQEFRSRAYASGNLRSDDKQIVSRSDGAIEIAPANPEVVYIPVYEPREVIVYQPRTVYRYYPVAYPSYYYPYPAGYAFDIPWFWGVTSYYSVGWHSHYVHVHHHTHSQHPYYLNSYYFYSDYYPRNSLNITVNVDNHSHVWRPTRRQGSGPRASSVLNRSSTSRSGSRTTVTTEFQPNASSTRATTNSSQRSSTGARSSVSERTTVRSEAAQSQASRSIPSSSLNTSQSRSIRTREPTIVTAPMTAPSTRAPATRQPNNNANSNRTRTTITSQGTSSRRPATGTGNLNQSRSSNQGSSTVRSPASSNRSSSTSSPRQAPSRSSAAPQTRQQR